MQLHDYITALTKIDGYIWEIIGAMKADILCNEQSNFSNQNVTAILPEEAMTYKGKSITKRKDGRWWTRYHHQGKSFSIYGKTQKECLQNLKQALNQLQKGQINYKSLTVGEWLKKWMQTYKQPKLKQSTLEQMQRYLKDVEPLHKLKLKNVTSITMQDFLNGITKPRKREKIHGFLKDAFTKAYKNRLVDYNIFDAVDSIPRQKKQSKCMTKEEEKTFVKACKQSHQGDLFLLCLYQGLRLGEAVALTYEDIDFENKTITINKAIDSTNELTTPKTTTSNRTIPLFERTARLLDKSGKGNVFKFQRKVYQNEMLRLCKRNNLQNISVHTLRHTFATRCSEAGIPPKVVQKWLGHSTIDMTLSVYTHVNQEFEQEMTLKFDTYFDTN